MLRVTTLNCNGIRSAVKKGLYPWLRYHRPDIVCLQELKCHTGDIEGRHPRSFRGFFHCAQKKGYSGVAVLTREKPYEVTAGVGIAAIDAEGRYLQMSYPNLEVISLYLPSGSSSEARQQAKFEFMEAFYPHLVRLRRSGREVLLCGDWNIAHKEIDLKNWRANQKYSGFLPEERDWIGKVFAAAGFVDVFRSLNRAPEQYTWWSSRGRAWEKNVGWRIDYQVATPGIAERAIACSIYKRKRFSDHAPLTIDYDWVL
ncbi:MAG: exodeoxyribonuclease III [Burkholderiales bacterium]